MNRVESSPTAALVRVRRLARVLAVGLTVCLVAIVARVVQLQVRPDEPIARMRDSQKSRSQLAGRRGNLVDRRGRVLASSRMVTRLFADAKLIDDLDAFSQTVSQQLGYDARHIRDTVFARYHSRHIVLDANLSKERHQKLLQHRIKGLATESWPVRDYPHGPLAGQLIGFVGYEGKGLEGAERMLDRKLTAEPGSMLYLRDSRRRPLWAVSSGYTPPSEGEPVQLSLDLVIQDIAQAKLREACEKYGADSGQLIVMQPHSGELLAIANYPEFDPSRAGQLKPELRRNRTVTDTFEPGSTFKPFIWAYATEKGFARLDETIDCTTSGVWVSPKGRRLRDAHANGKQTWEGVLVKSSNIGMAIVALRMQEHELRGAVKAFGFGDPTGSGLPGEVGGRVTPLKKWSHYSMTSVPMGQEVSVTGLQLARAYSAIANGGTLVQPTLIAYDPLNPATMPPIHERVLSPQTARITREVLRRVVTEGTGQKANSKLYSIIGKTGTAQISLPGKGYQPGQYIGSFCGAAPADDPQIVVVCTIQKPDPKKGYYGGIVAAPAAKEVIEQSLAYLGIAPDLSPAEARMETRVAANFSIDD